MATQRLKGLWIPADILLDEKLTRDEAKGRYVHNERKTRGHTNKNINPERTHLNYYFKKMS